MPSYNITLDDVSPLIQYEGLWSDSSHDDSQYSRYTDQTFHATQTANASASLLFNGTGVYLYGAKRPNHGSYSVFIDGQLVANSNGQGDDKYQQLLYGTSALSYGLHYVEITNTGAPSYLDLDSVDITIGDGKSETNLQDSIIDDAALIYNNDWNLSTDNPPSTYFNSTYHRTTTPQAVANIPFNGNAIQLFGTTSVDHGMFTLSLDGAPVVTLNGTAPTFRPKMLLYQFNGLSDGDHVLTIENLSNTVLELDQVVVSNYTASAPPSTTGGDDIAASHVASLSSTAAGLSLGTAAIAGLTVGILAIISMVVTGIFIITHQRKTKRRLYQEGVNDSPSIPTQPSVVATPNNTLGLPPSYDDAYVSPNSYLTTGAALLQPLSNSSEWPADRKRRLS